jgi:hypothetical protein
MIDDYKQMSNCCGCAIIGDGDEGLCSGCKEGCVSIEREEKEEMLKRAKKNLDKLNKCL